MFASSPLHQAKDRTVRLGVMEHTFNPVNLSNPESKGFFFLPYLPFYIGPWAAPAKLVL